MDESLTINKSSGLFLRVAGRARRVSPYKRKKATHHLDKALHHLAKAGMFISAPNSLHTRNLERASGLVSQVKIELKEVLPISTSP